MSILSPIRGNSTVYEENKNEVFDLIFSTISLKGKADFIDGKSGQALLFYGKSSVKIPHDKALNLTKAHAISFWLKWDGSGASWCPFIAKRSAGGLTVRVGGVIVCFYHSNLTLTKEISHESQT